MPTLQIRTRVLATVALCLLALGGVAAFAAFQIDRIGQEMAEITEQHIPMSADLAKISTHQLEQTIWFERMLRYAVAAEESAATGYQKSIERFEHYGRLVGAELDEAEALAARSLDVARTQANHDEFKHVLEALEAIEVEHLAFESHVREVMAMLAEGRVADAVVRGEEVDAEAEAIDHEVEALSSEIAAFTLAAARLAEQHEKDALFWLLVAAGLTVAVVGAITVVVIVHYLGRPLAAVVTALKSLLAGNMETEVRVLRDDEIGSVAAGLEAFRQKLIENARLEAEAVETQAEVARRGALIADLTARFDAEVTGVVTEVQAATGRLNETATTMTSASEQTLEQSTVILSAAEESARSIQSVASATEQLTASIQEIGRQTVESSAASRRAVDSAEGAKAQVHALVENSQKIGEVVELISDIAEQTNLLALNATIEAARAGEMGKGFAVVANEVKSLASQTARATGDIASQIQSMQAVTTDTAGAIESIVNTIAQVDEIINAIASAMEQQNAATAEIAQNIQHATQGAQDISASIDGVNETANSTGQSAASVMSAVHGLTEQSSLLRGQIDGFLRSVRSA